LADLYSGFRGTPSRKLFHDPDGTDLISVMARLESYGITDEIRSALADLSADGAEPARIITGDRSGYRVVTDKAELPAQIAGRFRSAIRQLSMRSTQDALP
jgi:hypothetical protein